MRKILSVLTAGLFAISSVATGVAQDTGTASVTIESSGLLVVQIADADFGTHSYSFVDQTATADVVVNMEDNTGTGAGWNVTILGTDFERDVATTFPVSQLTLATGTVVSTAGQAATGITAPGVTVANGPAGQKIASAPVLSGSGHYTATYPGTLTIPGGTLVGTYNSTLTVSIVTGP